MHDMCLYDWHVTKEHLHGFRHPIYARDNAKKYLNVGSKTEQIIRCHMWPLTLFHFPRCREGWIVSYADKVCCIKEVAAIFIIDLRQWKSSIASLI